MVLIFFFLRVIHRIYYFLIGHVQHFAYDPQLSLSTFFNSNQIRVTQHSLTSSNDGTMLQYSRIGSGPKFILLSNGVGTGFFMWLPVLKELLRLNPDIFNEITLIAPSFRGLFRDEETFDMPPVDITVLNCAEDLPDILKHAKQDKFHTIIGWSMGAQVAMTCCALHPSAAANLFLLNPSTGRTLHSVMQPVVPLPFRIQQAISFLTVQLFTHLKPIIGTPVWDILKVFACSVVFRLLLEISAFFGGFPPEQGAYFHEYMKDTFRTRGQTRALLDLIISLDATLPPEALQLNHRTRIVSGWADILTGVYHSHALAKGLKHSTHSMYFMGSHFLLLERPDLLALEISAFIAKV